MHEWWISDGSCCGLPLSFPPRLVSILTGGKRMREIFYHTRRFITNIKSEKKASDVLSSSRCQLVDIFTVSESYRISQSKSCTITLVCQSVTCGQFIPCSGFVRIMTVLIKLSDSLTFITASLHIYTTFLGHDCVFDFKFSPEKKSSFAFWLQT